MLPSLRSQALTLALSLGAALQLRAQDSSAVDPRAVQPERPTVATHAHTVAPGYVEFEIGVEGDEAGLGNRHWFSPVVTKLGLASHVQLNLSTPYAYAGMGQSAGIGDIAFGLKWRLLDDNAILGDFALLPSVKFPTGSPDKNTGTGTTDVGIIAIASYDIHGVSMDLNAGFTRVGAYRGNAASNAALWTVSFGIPVAGKLSWNAELFGYPTIDGSGNPSTVAFLAGPGFLVGRTLNLDCGFIAPISGSQPNALYAGFVWNAGSIVPRSR